MESVPRFAKDSVNDDEIVARIVLSPRDVDDTGNPKDGFIRLRKDETGISFLRYDFLGKKDFYACGEERRKKYSQKKEHFFVGWMQAVSKDIVALDPETIFFSIENPDEAPEHVLVCFKKDDKIIKGIVTDAYVLALIDELYHMLEFIKIA